MQARPGLSEFLAGQRTAEKTVYSGDIPNLHVFPCGKHDVRFGDNLRAKDTLQRLREVFAAYDEVIVDSPPVLAKSDATALARLVEEIVLVLRAGDSTQDEADAARRALGAVGGNIVGVILNAVDPRHSRYGYYYNYAYAESAEG
jgi:tyrosine-protein kinase Etk/Wzc